MSLKSYEAIDAANGRPKPTDGFGRPMAEPYTDIQNAALRYSSVSKFKVFLGEEDGTLQGPCTPGLIAKYTEFVFATVGIRHAGFVTVTLGENEHPSLQREFDGLHRVPKILRENGDVRYIFHHGGTLSDYYGVVAGVGEGNSVADTWARTELLLLPPTPGEGKWVRPPHLFIGRLPIDVVVAIKAATK